MVNTTTSTTHSSTTNNTTTSTNNVGMVTGTTNTRSTVNFEMCGGIIDDVFKNDIENLKGVLSNGIDGGDLHCFTFKRNVLDKIFMFRGYDSGYDGYLSNWTTEQFNEVRKVCYEYGYGGLFDEYVKHYWTHYMDLEVTTFDDELEEIDIYEGVRDIKTFCYKIQDCFNKQSLVYCNGDKYYGLMLNEITGRYDWCTGDKQTLIDDYEDSNYRVQSIHFNEDCYDD